MYTYTQEDIDRFWTHVDKTSTIIRPNVTTPCWEWTSQLRTGYGLFGLNGRPVSAHRFIFFVTHGTFAGVVRHSCNNRPCIRPSHLLSGTYSDNTRDCMNADRLASTLTNAIVAEARVLAREGANIHALAKRYNVNSWAILGAVRGTTWKYLDNEYPEVDISRKRKVSKLSHDDIAAILKALENPYHGIGNDLAAKYGVKHNTISAIRHGRLPANYAPVSTEE